MFRLTLLTILFATSLLASGCGTSSQDPDTSVHQLSVIGTDGSLSSESNRAELAYYDNNGEWTAEYALGNFPGLAPELYITSDTHDGEEEILFSGQCIDNADCSLGHFNCDIESDGFMICSWNLGPGPVTVDLAPYFFRTGGLPNFSSIGVRGCYTSNQNQRVCGEGIDTPVVVR